MRDRGPADARRYAVLSPIEALPSEVVWPELQELCVPPPARIVRRTADRVYAPALDPRRAR